MEIVHEQRELERYMREAVKVSNDSPVLLDRFLNDAIEVDVDALSDGKEVLIGGIMEHIEQAGVHSGDSAVLAAAALAAGGPHAPIARADRRDGERVERRRPHERAVSQSSSTKQQGHRLRARGQPARVAHGAVRSKATGRPLAKIAARCMVGQSLAQQGVSGEVVPPYYSVKEAVFPFIKFPGVDTILGPEMKSTGEVMGVGETFGEAFVKSQLAAGVKLPQSGRAFISVKNADKARVIEVSKMLAELGFELVATRGTAAALTARA
jgi:carbamoyl-phosphate synthase large subunit